MSGTIKCFNCAKHVRVVQKDGQSRIEAHDHCRGSNAVVKGNWRDDPTLRDDDSGQREPKVIDGYWLRMGRLMVDSLVNEGTLRQNLLASELDSLAQRFGELFDNAHNMGIRLGEARGRYAESRK